MSVWLPIEEIAENVRTGKVKASDLVEKSLKTIQENSGFDAIIQSIETRAKQRAEDIDKLASNGKDPGKLAGVPFIAKDNFLTYGSETTAASNILKGFEAPYQATAIERLEAEGAICVAKANLDAFAHGSSTENSDFMTTKNPHDKTRVPGGSSGGSAAAVVLDMAPFALGSDTGGSIRLPAGFCGCVGYKPSYGLVSRNGVVAMASSTDVIGPLTNTVDEAAYVLDIMSGKDELDSTTIEKDQTGYTSLNGSLNGKKVGIIKEYMAKGLSEEVESSIKATIELIRQAGAELEEVSLPSSPLGLASYYVLCPAEITSNLSRYDGQRYGFTDKEAGTIDESFSNTRTIGFGAEAKRRIMIGSYVLSSGYYDAYYKTAQKIRTLIMNEFEEAFNKYDFLIGPTAAGVAFKIGDKSGDPLQMYLSDVMTVSANLAGIPAVSIPAAKATKLPVGLQIMAPYKADKQLLEAAGAIEKIIKQS